MTYNQTYWDFMRDGMNPQQRARQAAEARTRFDKPLWEWDVYLAGSLRNPAIPTIAKTLGSLLGTNRVFSDWYAAGPEADDHWKTFYQTMGYNYVEALKEPASVNVFNFDKQHMSNANTMVLALPAGKSGHMELGWFLGRGNPGYILLDDEDARWDVMYQFATGVTSDIEELSEWIKADLNNTPEPEIFYG